MKLFRIVKKPEENENKDFRATILEEASRIF